MPTKPSPSLTVIPTAVMEIDGSRRPHLFAPRNQRSATIRPQRRVGRKDIDFHDLSWG